MVCSDIGDGVLVIDNRSEHIGTIIGKRREMVGGVGSHGTGRRTTGIDRGGDTGDGAMPTGCRAGNGEGVD